MKKSHFKLIILSILIPAFMASCGGGESDSKDSKPVKSKAGKSEISKMVTMAADYKAELQKLTDEAENAGDNVDKITKLATEYAEKEKKFNQEFADFVANNSGKLILPVEQELYNEYFEIKSIELVSAKEMDHVSSNIVVTPLKSPYPTKDNRVCIKFVNSKGEFTGYTFYVFKPSTAAENEPYSNERRFDVTDFTDAVKAVVISEEEYNTLR